MEGREFRIPVTYGHLAAIEWGNTDGHRILALHGWQDNALTFAPLVQLLPSNLHIVALDFSGHGLSSHLGPGANYNGFHYMCDILQAAHWLKWETFSLLGHSMGAIIAIKFATFFPAKVQNLITLDIVYPSADLPILQTLKTADLIQYFMSIDRKEAYSPLQMMSWDEAVSKFGESRTNLSVEKLELLIKRSVQAVGKDKNGKTMYVFNRDHRLKTGNCLEYTITSVAKTVEQLPKSYRGTWLAIVNEENWFTPNIGKLRDTLEEHHTKNMKYFEVITLKNINTHFFHLQSPELVAPHIAKMFANVIPPSRL